MGDVVDTWDSACATCGADITVQQLDSEDFDEAIFQGGCYFGAFLPGHPLNPYDDRPAFYHECEDCCPVCSGTLEDRAQEVYEQGEHTSFDEHNQNR